MQERKLADVASPTDSQSPQIIATACTAAENLQVTACDTRGEKSFQQPLTIADLHNCRSKQGPSTFDIVATAGLPLGKDDALQHFPLPDRSGLFADMLGHLDFSSSVSTVSPKFLVSLCQSAQDQPYTVLSTCHEFAIST